MAFKHPGTTLTKTQIDKLPGTRASGDPVTQKSVEQLVRWAAEDANKPVRAFAEVCVYYVPSAKDLSTWSTAKRDAFLKQKVVRDKAVKEGRLGGNGSFKNAGTRCFLHTLAYLVTKDRKYAEKAIAVVAAWAGTCKKFGFTAENGPLEAGWGLVTMAKSMELLKYTYKLPANVETDFVAFVRAILMPNLSHFDADGRLTRFPAKGNWGTTILQARLQMAIFTEDKKEFDFCVANGKRMFFDLFVGNTGQEQETLRDLTHTQMGLGGLIGLSEVLYNQGIDIYSTNDDILRRSLEYHASILLGEPIPKELQGPGKSITDNEFVPANWEIAYHHFVNFKRRPMPKTLKLLRANRPEWFFFEHGNSTLTHYGTAVSSRHFGAHQQGAPDDHQHDSHHAGDGHALLVKGDQEQEGDQRAKGGQSGYDVGVVASLESPQVGELRDHEEAEHGQHERSVLSEPVDPFEVAQRHLSVPHEVDEGDGAVHQAAHQEHIGRVKDAEEPLLEDGGRSVENRGGDGEGVCVEHLYK
jgi:Alginate lyase